MPIGTADAEKPAFTWALKAFRDLGSRVSVGEKVMP
jgi:hypothetical protein